MSCLVSTFRLRCLVLSGLLDPIKRSRHSHHPVYRCTAPATSLLKHIVTCSESAELLLSRTLCSQVSSLRASVSECTAGGSCQVLGSVSALSAPRHPAFNKEFLHEKAVGVSIGVLKTLEHTTTKTKSNHRFPSD